MFGNDKGFHILKCLALSYIDVDLMNIINRYKWTRFIYNQSGDSILHDVIIV